MTSFRQIEANRCNAIRSTGPNTEQGKRRSRRNAVRHGLCAETVIENVEDVDDYRAFEAAIIADYDAETAVERELVLRLASLLWRLRRATSIETDLLRMQAEILRKRRQRQERGQLERPQTMQLSALEPSIQPRFGDASMDDHPNDPSQSEDLCNRAFDAHPVNSSLRMAPRKLTPRDLAHCFQRLVNFDNAVFERLGRYETALWRQMAQTVFMLQSAKRR